MSMLVLDFYVELRDDRRPVFAFFFAAWPELKARVLTSPGHFWHSCDRIMLMALCADCGELVGDVHWCPRCDSNMHSFCGIGVGDGGYGQQRTCKKCAAPVAAPETATVAAAAPAAAAKPPTVAPATMMQLQPALVSPLH